MNKGDVEDGNHDFKVPFFKFLGCRMTRDDQNVPENKSTRDDQIIFEQFLSGFFKLRVEITTDPKR